jgi:hypothetical protein
MDGSTFDTLARLTAVSPGHRGLLRSGLAVVLAGIGATSLLGVDDVSAKSCEKKWLQEEGLPGQERQRRQELVQEEVPVQAEAAPG